ncbi:uncharacterized protein LOC124182075 [Neodiprion fabricii]|uniref:uncharacterized protein LOC124182075 n=1 Tax=Neodiprion fabricii TaxID=2872261 RepID=UPI001ED96332|nr:uncharacterized protein LOC124182075 [Neodiprion fabricii]XP_046424829.1 uncharacterized protein LOC124182075 [Neodiprion fabricii]
MEDGDGESKVMDTAAAAVNNECKETDYEESNNETIYSCSDQINTSSLENLYSSESEDNASKSLGSSSRIAYKGFKKRILAQTQENQPSILRKESVEIQFQTKALNSRGVKEKKLDTKRGKITEYAQYLGLQPAAKYKCLKCQSGATFCTMSMLKQHQRNCTTSMSPMQGVLGSPESTSMPIATNFRITRKVYLCSACGTYFENWNLFLHMREVHKRHICLFCLGMFGQAERLSYHLSSKHSVPETEFQSVEDFYNAFKGSCYLICCNCEKVFSETDDFYNHFCSVPQRQPTAKTCSVCRQTDSHASSCALVSEARPVTADTTLLPVSSTLSMKAQMQSAVGNGKGTCKRIIRNNRLKPSNSSKIFDSSVQKLFETEKTEEKAQLIPGNDDGSESYCGTSESSDTEFLIGTARDTVAETIMEVSRCIEMTGVDDSARKSEKPEDEACSKKSPRDASTESYDSVTETIMEVSRFHGDSSQVSGQDSKQELEDSSQWKEPIKSTELVQVQDLVSLSLNPELDERLNSAGSICNESANEEPNSSGMPVTTQNDETSPQIQRPDSPVKSSVSHSLFSPQHEVQTLDDILKGTPPKEDVEKEESEAPLEEEEPNESTEKEEVDEFGEPQTSVSFNAVAATDRSLVIKICTNRVSKFSVSNANTMVNSRENYNINRESEENNNGEGTTSEEKTPNLSEIERDSTGGYQLDAEESDTDSEKLAVVDCPLDETEKLAKDTNDENNSGGEKSRDGNQDKTDFELDGILLAGQEVPSIDLNVEGTMESMEIETLLKHCIEAASPTCIYCNHARQIAVNGRQLGLHMLAEHRFLPQHPAIIIHREQFISRIKKALQSIEAYFFNLDSYNSTAGTYNVSNGRSYECFHCRFHSSVHKELYLHNRKMHQKTILICIMCKSTFYSYSELLCHICPGVYSPNINVKYRCCLCTTNNLPSAFRLMVHLRKRHHACDVCLESTGNQQRLSNHVWKHKLHHLCYRCGIAYRNKPDITKHLFWKHGTESVVCKKCLQKKWPHVYHFCIPPTAFVCEECNSSFSRAVALKVHKRLHSNDSPYSCENCTAQFISKKLMLKHKKNHKEQVDIRVDVPDETHRRLLNDEERSGKDKVTSNDSVAEIVDVVKESKESIKKVVDVYDLPPLNLSSDSDSDSQDEKGQPSKGSNQGTPAQDILKQESKSMDDKFVEPVHLTPSEFTKTSVEIDLIEDEKKEEVQIIDGIWDNFKSYTASLEMKESSSTEKKNSDEEIEILRKIILSDHDYCVVASEMEKINPSSGEEGVNAGNSKTHGTEHDYNGKPSKSPEMQPAVIQNAGCENETSKKKPKTPRKKKHSGSTSSSDSSSNSDSSNCSCGTNCSCSSSSSGSSSSGSSSSSESDSSASEGSPRKQLNRKDRRKFKDLTKRGNSDSVEPDSIVAPLQIENGPSPADMCNPAPPPDTLLRESDLDTDETETDEDFYDEHPQQLANRLLTEKRNQLTLLAAVAPASSDSPVTEHLNNGAINMTEHIVKQAPPLIAASRENTPQPKKKAKTKKRKKSDKDKQRTSTPTVESIKLNIPKSFYQTKPGFVSSTPDFITVVPSRSSTPNFSGPGPEVCSAKESHTGNSSAIHTVGSESETDNKRSSKRKRVPKRFYGDSSDEDSEKQPALKWRKVEPPPPAPAPAPVTNLRPLQTAFFDKSLPFASVTKHVESPTFAVSDSESEAQADSSSDSSGSDTELHQQEQRQQQPLLHQHHQLQQQQQSQVQHYHHEQQPPPMHHLLQHNSHTTENNAPVLERSDNLYCYCQCPYDEVSEMIACDGDDCRIEWFHFECVGIMVPPKGKWYCPDCRKKHGIVNSNDDYFD